MAKINKILVPVDLFEETFPFVDWVKMLSDTFKAETHLLYVISKIHNIEGYGFSREDVDHYKDGIESWANERMKKLVANYCNGLKISKTHISKGTPFFEIVKYARDQKIDLIVMSVHGKLGLEHRPQAAISDQVFREAPCPVLCVRPMSQNLPAMKPMT